MTFGYAIPTYKNHIQFLAPLLDSIKDSTVLPDQVSISCSSMLPTELNLPSLDFSSYPFNIVLSATEEYKNPSQNRNIAASKLSTDIVSFIDGDDWVLPKRTEFVKKAMEEGSVVVCHNFNYLNHPEVNRLVELTLYKGYIDSADDKCPFPRNSKVHKTYHCAHVTVTKSLFDQFKYDESESLKYMEDCEYLKRIIITGHVNGHSIDYIENILSVYRKFRRRR